MRQTYTLRSFSVTESKEESESTSASNGNETNNDNVDDVAVIGLDRSHDFECRAMFAAD